ncbi:F0F1 ATP synthase subunit delta [Sporosarcina jiandibaonis]|uniref:F0F1 ATP synthase subunit delta n=1 Tax=Sporosarcina jiandibaonis TaxID=2715535 RepID=UPI0015552D88
MSKSIVANRYAEALFELATEKGQTSVIQDELLEIKKAFQANPDLGELLENPRFPLAKKKELLATLFKDANSLIQDTLFVLLEKKRINEIINFVDEFRGFVNDAAGIADADVYSTRPLTDSESAAISSTFARKVGKQSLRINNIIDPTLIGGIRLQIGNRIFDNSLVNKLERLKRDMIGS